MSNNTLLYALYRLGYQGRMTGHGFRGMREQRKQGADFTKMYETGKDGEVDGVFTTPYQYTEAELKAAVDEANRMGKGEGHGVAVHATGYAVAAGVMSVDHAYELSAATMRMMKEKGIPAVPTFAISEYFADHASSPAMAERERRLQAFHAAEFKKQLAAGVPMRWERCGAVPAWDAGSGAGADGGVWDAGG